MNERVERLRAKMAEKELPALLVGNDENRRYLSGFTGSAGFLLITPDRAILLTDFRYTEQAAAQAPDFVIRKLEKGMTKELDPLQKEFGVTRLAFEAGSTTYATWEGFAKAAAECGISLLPTTDLVEPLRAVKDAEELATIERAVKIADEAVDTVSQRIQPGMTERQVAWEIEKYMREAGAEGLAFEVIVGSGPNGAMPHARPSDRPIAAGEPIVLDLGCIVDGYRSDLTRTVCVGAPDDAYLNIYDIVLRAQEQAEKAILPGMTGGDADKIARDLIAGAGYGEQFGHSLGHGIGLQTHEGPYVRKDGEDVLREGMVFSVEPGIYLPGQFGVRIEDLVVLEKSGPRVLSKAPKLPAMRRTE
jgi:Xaa-Pro aminopeptidase